MPAIEESDSRSTWFVGALLFVALMIRLGWGVSQPSNDESVLRSLPDQREYLLLGRNLLSGAGLVFHDDRIDADVRAFRTPGYPLLVAACGGSIRAIRIVQAMLDTSTVLAVYFLARRWLGARASLIAAAIVGVNPFLIYFSALVLSETLFIALLAWGMALVVRPRIVWAGLLLLAFSVLVRPGAIALPALLGFVGARVGTDPGPRRWRSAVTGAIGGALMTLLVLFPWAWRNDRVLGEWLWTTTNSGVTMYDGFNPSATGASDQRFVTEMAAQLHAMSEVDRSEFLGSRAKQFVADHPGRAFELGFAKLARTWSPIPLSREYGGDRKIVVVAMLYMVPLFALSVAGLWVAGSLTRSAKVLLLVPAIYFSVAHAISVGSLRYRLPADVPMAVLAACVKSVVKRQKASV